MMSSPPTGRACGSALFFICLAGHLLGCDAEGVPGECTEAAPYALRECIGDYGAAVAECYARTDVSCAADDARTSGALARLADRVRRRCDDGELFGLDANAAVGRLQNACESEASSLAWRVYGGPQGSAWTAADAETRECLQRAHETGRELMDSAMQTVNACLAADACDADEVASARTGHMASAEASLVATCPDLDQAIGKDIPTFVAIADEHVDCAIATSTPDTAPLPLRCGPSAAEFDIPRGEWTQVVVDGDRWGTLCGDGSAYAFWVRLAPAGQPLDRLVIGMQGGGVCLVEEDCTARLQSNPELFRALDDTPTGAGGIGSDDPDVNPFANWTRVYLPYCNQDVFAGGGVNETLGALSLPRYGSRNIRAAIRMTRDVLWRELDAAGGAGFRPDEVVTFFGGWSAGGYGTLYNYHWLLDELQWPRTIAFPDGGLALDNGTLLGVRGLGRIKIEAWGIRNSLPAYCFAGDCAVGPTLYRAMSPRLLQVPEQQMLVLSNQLDDIQQGDAFFNDRATWINTVRESYCDTKDLPGIQYYLTSVSDESTHVVSIRTERWEASVAGETMRDFFVRAVDEPATLVDHAEEADFVTAIDGVMTFPCDVAP